MNSYRSIPLSRKKIQEVALFLRNKLNISFDEPFPVINFLEFVLPHFEYTVKICENTSMKENYALTLPDKKILKIREDVYELAVQGFPRHLFTIAHEFGHIFFHDNESISLARTDEKIKTFEDPEWQANTFAAELLVPSCRINGKSIDEIMTMYGCSRKVAEIQLSKAKKATKRLKSLVTIAS